MYPATDMDNLRFISLGLGQQSTALYLMSSLGQLPTADYAVFADTGSETKETYAYLKWLLNWQKEHNGIPIIRTGRKNSLYHDLIKGTNCHGTRFASIPAFTKNPDGSTGMLRRQCTEEYKITQIQQTIRNVYGLKRYQRAPQTEIWLGITIDEMERMKFPRHKWQGHVYPFCDYKAVHNRSERLGGFPVLRRADCTHWLREQGFPVPPKSACFFCPYQSNARWLNMKKNQPNEWKRAVKLDQQIRDSSRKGVEQPIYLHQTCVPLDEVNLNENQLDLFPGECDGLCGV